MKSLNCDIKKSEECNIFKSQEEFYEYKNNDVHIRCKSSFNKNVRCEFCDREFNKKYL